MSSITSVPLSQMDLSERKKNQKKQYQQMKVGINKV